MALKKQQFAEGEIVIFDEACIYKRGDYWQLLSLLELEEVNIVVAPSNYGGITILNLDESAVSTLSSIRNIEALLLDEVVAAELQQPSAASDALSFKSLDGVDEREQYEHLSQLLHIQKQRETKNEILRSQTSIQ